MLEVLKQKFQSPTSIVKVFVSHFIRMEALLTIDDNLRLDGWVSSPWAPLGGPTQLIFWFVENVFLKKCIFLKGCKLSEMLHTNV